MTDQPTASDCSFGSLVLRLAGVFFIASAVYLIGTKVRTYLEAPSSEARSVDRISSTSSQTEFVGDEKRSSSNPSAPLTSNGGHSDMSAQRSRCTEQNRRDIEYLRQLLAQTQGTVADTPQTRAAAAEAEKWFRNGCR